MKVAIVTDLEGTAGVVDFETQTYPGARYFEQAKFLATEEVNAACEGAFKSGADKILVIDGHGPGGLVPEKIHRKAFIFHGRPVSRYWLMEQSWDALFLLGHHAMNGTEKGNLNHTYSSRSVVNMWLNGEKIGEIGINIYLAGWFGIPTILVTGDEAACQEACQYVPRIQQAIVKWGFTRTSAISLSHQAACEVIEKAAATAVKRVSEYKPAKPEGKCELLIEFLSSADAFIWQQRRDAEKISATTVRFTGKHFLEVYEKWRG
ncbi:MAG: M55 family metallopeptidase [Candidatus Omnitrophica bacterium]|nr:M55 family metallopeptidase [Candidatus Omnitrophota bacterium]